MKALLVVDPVNDFLNTKGFAWGAVKKSVNEHNTIQHLKDIVDYSNQTSMVLNFCIPTLLHKPRRYKLEIWRIYRNVYAEA